MTIELATRRLDTAEALALHLDGLVGRDKRFASVREIAGEVVLRESEPGFAGMARVICGQQLSVASARAIWGRFAAVAGATAPERFLVLDEAALRGVGLSGGKYRAIRAVAEAVTTGDLDFGHAERLPVEEAVAYMTRIKGIGPWTAEIYLMFCAGHPDVFPSGDLALQKAAAHAFGLEERPDAKALAALAVPWSPHRAAAALLFWRYFAAIQNREGIAI